MGRVMRIGDAGCRGDCWSRLIFMLHTIRRMASRKVVLKTVYFSKLLIKKDQFPKSGPLRRTDFHSPFFFTYFYQP